MSSSEEGRVRAWVKRITVRRCAGAGAASAPHAGEHSPGSGQVGVGSTEPEALLAECFVQWDREGAIVEVDFLRGGELAGEVGMFLPGGRVQAMETAMLLRNNLELLRDVCCDVLDESLDKGSGGGYN